MDNNRTDMISQLLKILIDAYQNKESNMTEEKRKEAEALIEEEKSNFTEEQLALYKKFQEEKEAYDILQEVKKKLKNGSIHKYQGANGISHGKIYAAIALGITLGGVGTVAAQNITNGPSIEHVQSANKESSAKKAQEIKTAEMKAELPAGEKVDLTKEKAQEIYGEYADKAASIIKSSRTNGLALESDEVAHLISIANLHNLTEDQKKELASAKHPITLNDWTNFTDKLFIDCIDVTPDTIAFDANLLFGNAEDAKDVNYVMQTFAKWNTTQDENLKSEFKNFLKNYTEEENFKQKLKENPAAAELVLRASSLATDEAIGLLDRDDFTNDLFRNEGCKLAETRMALGADLKVDQRMFKDNTIKITDEDMTNTKTLQKNKFLEKYDDNKILQIKFVANQMDLTSNQEQDLANNLKLEQVLDSWKTFGDDYVKAIENGETFDANTLFLNDEKAASELNEAQEIYQSYLKVINGEIAATSNVFNKEWNELYYRNFANDQEGILESNKPASYLLAQLLQSANEKGLKLDKTDNNLLEEQDKNGTVGLYEIIVGKGLSDSFCNSIKNTTEDELGNIYSHHTLWEETYSDIASSINSITITSDKNISSASASLYEQILSESRSLTEKEEQNNVNRHEIYVEMIEERVKDIKLQNVTHTEDEMTARLNARGAAGTIGGYTLGGGTTQGDVKLADESGVKISGYGSENRDENLELWSNDQVEQAENQAGASKGQVVNSTFESVPEKVVDTTTKEETIFTDKDKQNNDAAADKGYITDAERDEMNENGEVFEGGDIVYEYNYNLSDADTSHLIGISDEFALAEEKFQNGKISEEEFQKAVTEFEKSTNDIFGKYDNQDSNKPEIDNGKTDSVGKTENGTTTTVVTKTQEEIVKEYGVDLGNSFEYEGTTYYFSEKEGTYVSLEALTSLFTVDTKTEEVEHKVVEEKVIAEETVGAKQKENVAVAAYKEEATPAVEQTEQIQVQETTPAQETVQVPVQEPTQDTTAQIQTEENTQPAAEQIQVQETTPAQEAPQAPEPAPAQEPTQDTATQIQELEALKEQITAPETEETQSLGL